MRVGQQTCFSLSWWGTVDRYYTSIKGQGFSARGRLRTGNMLAWNTCRWSKHTLHFKGKNSEGSKREHMGPNILIWVGLWLGNNSGSRSRFLPSLCNKTKLNCSSELHQSVEFSGWKGGFYSFFNSCGLVVIICCGIVVWVEQNVHREMWNLTAFTLLNLAMLTGSIINLG